MHPFGPLFVPAKPKSGLLASFPANFLDKMSAGILRKGMALSTYFLFLMSFHHKRTFLGNFIKGWDEST